MSRVLEYYQSAAPLIEASFAQTPIVFRHYPNGLDEDGVFHVTTVPLTADKLLWLIHAEYAVEFYTWAPTLLDTDRLRFGRILLEAPPGVGFERVKLAALAMRSLLFNEAKLEAVPLLDGGAGIALWMPLADAPLADVLRRGLHQLCRRAEELHPDLVSNAFNTHHDGRVHLHVSSNASGHYSAVPYSLRVQGMTVCMPIHWEEFGSCTGANVFGCAELPARLRAEGNVFEREVKVIGGSVLARRCQDRRAPSGPIWFRPGALR